MKTICLYLHVHQPFRLKKYRFFDIGSNHDYYDDFQNENIIRKVAQNCYLPANQILLDLIQQHPDFFKVSFSISGPALDQLEKYAPEVVEGFVKLAQTGNVEFIAEPYAHSLAFHRDEEEFKAQIESSKDKIKKLFKQTPQTFHNTEMIYNDRIGEIITEMGFRAVITEGASHILGWKSPHYVYYNALNPKLKIMLRSFNLSDDIAFRFSDRSWSEWPLTTEKYVSWLNGLSPSEKIVNLFLSYETFGEHHSADTGILEFLKALPQSVRNYSDFTFQTPKEAILSHPPKAALSVPDAISWADIEKDLTSWLGNELQDEAFAQLYKLRPKIMEVKDEELEKDWNYLQISDHFLYMCTKFFSDGQDHNYFNPFGSPYDAFINYMNVLSDFELRLEEALKTRKKKKSKANGANIKQANSPESLPSS
ncbi:MAG: glycoside hydrolase family 57 protein [Bacteroidota bacterium]